MNVEFLIEKYKFTWGHNPRGYGSWAFAEHGNPKSEIYWVQGTYTEAKKKMKAKIREINPDIDYVLIDVLT